MKRSQLAEIKKLQIGLLIGKVQEARTQLEELILERSATAGREGSSSKKGSSSVNNKAIKNKKRDIAQLETVIRQKQLLEELEEKNA